MLPPLVVGRVSAQLGAPGTWSRVNSRIPGWLPATVGFRVLGVERQDAALDVARAAQVGLRRAGADQLRRRRRHRLRHRDVAETLAVAHFGTAFGLKRMFLSKNSRARVVFVPATV